MESFAELLAESEVEKKMRPGAIIHGVVVQIGSEYVTVHAGLKSESIIPVEQFRDENGALEVEVGELVPCGRPGLPIAIGIHQAAGKAVAPLFLISPEDIDGEMSRRLKKVVGLVLFLNTNEYQGRLKAQTGKSARRHAVIAPFRCACCDHGDARGETSDCLLK